MSGYAAFKTNKGLEETGVWFDYGKFRLLCARSGGSNRRFARMFEAKTRPYQRAIKTDTLDIELSNRLMRELFAEAVILDWNTKNDEGQWVQRIELPDGSLGPVTRENILLVLEDVPELWADIQNEAQKAANYRDAVREANAGN